MPQRGWIVRSDIGWEENESFFIRVWQSLSSRHVLKPLGESQKEKRTISASGGLGLLQKPIRLYLHI